jgi:Fur family ferric uptake transcriptional regulator
LTAEEIYLAVKKKHPGIGYATVYRTLKLLCEAGICRELTCEDGIKRYEYQSQDEHHDHLICTKCGIFVEVVDPEIEKLQERLFKSNGFYPERHRMELYGICKKCSK